MNPTAIQFMRPTVLGVALCVSLAGCSQQKSVTLFEDITAHSGLGSYVGMTHGVAWGDYDNDGKPDLYVTNHLKPAMLFRNLGGGRFADVTSEVIQANATGGDKHGAAWADFNNDGRLDLVQLTGAIQGAGVEPKRLYVNEVAANGGIALVDRAAELGVDNLPGRTRMPLWLDANLDGKLDLFHGAEGRFDNQVPPFLFAQQSGRFADATSWLPLASRSAPFCVLTALNDDRYPELICRLMGKTHTTQVFDLQTLPARTLDWLPKTSFEDVVAGDFDNDGAVDVFLPRKNAGGRVALAFDGARSVTAQVEVTPQNLSQPSVFSLRTKGTLNVNVAAQNAGDLTPADIRMGANASQPAGMQFSITPGSVSGMPAPPAGNRASVLIGSPEAGQWQIQFHAQPALFATKPKVRYLSVRIQSTEAIDDVAVLGDGAKDEAAAARLFMNRDGKLVEEADKRGVNEVPIAGTNAVAGDFDNDMDLDIFVLGSGDAGKTANLLLLNNGKGKFAVVKHAGGAAGWLVGVGDSVTTADVDGDGFLDLLTASGASMGRSLGLPSDNGRYQLFRNVGNGNHWLMIDLEGTQSNRNGIGARVSVTVDGVTQLRVQDGGVHERGQNHSRLHFGLSKHAQIDKIIVRWPSGKTQELRSVKTNQVLKITEPNS